MKTVEELMRPRYKVIADYPGTPYTIGNIVGNSNPAMFDSYPAIFKPLAWWEEREADEMPAYVKWIKGRIGQVCKVEKHYVNFCVIEGTNGGVEAYSVLEPTTQADYEEYLKTR